MKIREGFVLRRVMGQAMLIAVGDVSREFNGMIKLNDTAADLWQWLADGADEQALIARLQEEYEVDAATAAADVARFVENLKTQGLLVE